MNRFFRPLIFVFFFSLLSVQVTLAQSLRPKFERKPSDFDVQHYIIRTRFDRQKKMVFGDTTVRLKPLKNDFNTLLLDAVGMRFQTVRLEPEGKDLNFKTNDQQIIIKLDRNYSISEELSVRLVYSAKPEKGVYFVDALKKNSKLVHSAQIWTQGESQESRHWFPSNDFPDDKATTEQFLTVDKGETAISNGELVETIPEQDGTVTFHYKMPVVHSTYLTSFIIGNYTKIEDQHGPIPLGFYVYPGQTQLAQKAFGKTGDMMRIFEEVTGVKYPYNKYDQTMVAGFNLGGMENITATTLADTEIFFANFEFGRGAVYDLVSHELAHSWFGNLVTCKNWSELWLNEGFATFMEAVYREKTNGRNDYIRKVKDDADQFMNSYGVSETPHGLYNLLADPNDDDSMFDTTTYQKGGAVIHTLRETVGDEPFWRAINIYLQRHKFNSVETTDLQKVMEEVSGQDLDWFFNQWVRGTGYPRLKVERSFNLQKKTLTLTITQTQEAQGLTPAVFVLPMNLQIKTKEGIQNEAILVNKRIQTFSLKVNSRPTEIQLDKEEKIPIKLIKYNSQVQADR